MSYKVTETLVESIRRKTKTFNENYQRLFHKNLTPKFHFLNHYATIVKKSGPLRNLWSYKFEGKHKQFKIYAHVITSRKNIPITFCFKQQMVFANFLLKNAKHNDIIFKKSQHNKKIKEEIGKRLKISIATFAIFVEAEIYGYTYNSEKYVATFEADFGNFSLLPKNVFNF